MSQPVAGAELQESLCLVSEGPCETQGDPDVPLVAEGGGHWWQNRRPLKSNLLPFQTRQGDPKNHRLCKCLLTV